MASALFLTYERNMKRQFWMNILDAQVETTRRLNFRASLINNPITGRPIEPWPVSAPEVARAAPKGN
jgi:hypothetical protein